MSTITGLLHLQATDPGEAYFAASRLFARSASADAMALMLRMDSDRAVPALLGRFRGGGAALRLNVARSLRLELDADRVQAILEALAGSADPTEHQIAAEIAGYMPAGLAIPWLETFADADATSVREAAREAIRSRALEAAAMVHLAVMPSSPKPRQWARLHVVVQSVDPAFLWSREDPATIGPTLKALPFEFTIEAEQLVSKRRKKIDDDAKKADRNR